MADLELWKPKTKILTVKFRTKLLQCDCATTHVYKPTNWITSLCDLILPIHCDMQWMSKIVVIPQTIGAFTCSTDVTWGVRGPGDAVDTSPMVVQPSHRSARHTYIQDDHLSNRNVNARDQQRWKMLMELNNRYNTKSFKNLRNFTLLWLINV